MYDENKKIGYILPIYILIKNLIKKNNNYIFLLNDNINNINKINLYNVKKKSISIFDYNNIKEINCIYHNKLKCYIPINTFYLIEGDVSKYVNIYNNLSKKIYILYFEEDTNLDININTNILYNEYEDKIKYNLNVRLLKLILHINKTLAHELIHNIIEYNIKEYNIMNYIK